MNTTYLMSDSPVGPLLFVATDEQLVAIRFLDDKDMAPVSAGSNDLSPLLAETGRQLRAYFGRQLRDFDLPLAPRGTEFQRQVWLALADIPWGESRSYGDIARVIGRPRAVRAVGAANGANPLPIVLPCHRVIGADGSLTGYAGGLERKRCLLALEGRL